MPQRGRVWAEIDVDALVHNYRRIKEAARGAKILAAVKAEAYGHGGREVARILEHQDVDFFGVASVEEGIDLRTNGQIRKPVLLLSPVPYREIGLIFDYNLTPNVTEQAFAKALVQEANRRSKVLGVHVEVDTGMGRSGISIEEAPALVSLIANKQGLKLEALFTHFPSAETDPEFTKEQMSLFDALVERLKGEGYEIPALHSANSAALFKYPDARYDLVRPGLALYGMEPEGFSGALDLRPVMSLRTRIVNLRTLPKGASVSYGRTCILESQTLVATLSVGYGDGYPRSLSNKGEVLYKGQRRPILGTICMDLTMVDLTPVPLKGTSISSEESKEVTHQSPDTPLIGDEVTLIGKDGGARVSVEEIARWAATIPYEITTRVSPRVTRIYKTAKRILGARTLLGSTPMP